MEQLGLEAIKNGQVAVLILAAGQGTRLGYDKPKALFPIGPLSEKCLLEILIDRVNAISTSVPIYVMVSRKSHFDAFKDRIIVFEQPELPCLDDDGHIIMETPTQPAMAPNGNGAVFSCMPALPPNIKIVSQCAIDNVMAKPLDPYTIGYHIHHECDCVITTVLRNDPQEQVGVVWRDPQGVVRVIEYSERNSEKDSHLAHICINTFSSRLFKENIQLPYHVARNKKIPTWKDPEQRGNKREMFIFDIFPLVSRVHVLQVDRSRNFSPLKTQGQIVTSRDAFIRECRQKVLDAGGVIENEGVLEVDCALSMDELRHLLKNKSIRCPLLIGNRTRIVA
jgi:UDP-N-acetylglucosamine/UDP-N-acetylgalactosamine diphosphorylase